MSLPHALLTALVERSSSGLELSARFDKSIGLFWHATHQQIYRELAYLEQQGWVESVAAPAARGRKRVYRVLPAGRRELRRWAGEAEDPKPSRNDLMLRMRAEAAVGKTGVGGDIERRLKIHHERLAQYREIERRDFSGPGRTRENRIQHLILLAGIMTQQMWIDWSEIALQQLREADGEDSRDSGNGVDRP